MKAVRCPVCHGKGIVRLGWYLFLVTRECVGCEGKGWVEIHERGEVPVKDMPVYAKEEIQHI